jgi:hypothetical protein
MVRASSVEMGAAARTTSIHRAATQSFFHVLVFAEIASNPEIKQRVCDLAAIKPGRRERAVKRTAPDARLANRQPAVCCPEIIARCSSNAR